jgi:phosphohistidine phosphatase
MKKLVLMRHGKSSWNYDVSDKERPLKSRGKNDSALVARAFSEISEIPDKIYSSPAKRARDTCGIFLKTLNIPFSEAQIIENLYDFGGQNVITFLKDLPNSLSSVMIFGHNHALTSLTNSFGNKYIDNLPTSGLVEIEFDINEWIDIKNGTTKQIIIPKALR